MQSNHPGDGWVAAVHEAPWEATQRHPLADDVSAVACCQATIVSWQACTSLRQHTGMTGVMENAFINVMSRAAQKRTA